jgi:hypothetical protein
MTNDLSDFQNHSCDSWSCAAVAAFNRHRETTNSIYTDDLQQQVLFTQRDPIILDFNCKVDTK